MIRVRKIHEDSKVPTKAHYNDAGYDLFAYIPKNEDILVNSLPSDRKWTLKPMERRCIPTGIQVAVDTGTCWQIWPRSGLALKKGIEVLGGLGDAGYRGEVGVIIVNLSSEDVSINHEEKIAQLVHAPLIQGSFFQEVKELDATVRGAGGFGSTGTS